MEILRERFEIEPYCASYVPAGWMDIVFEAFEKLSKLDSWDPEKVAQIKEKFGGLRIYLDYSEPLADAIIREAEIKASTTCMRCSDPGTRTSGGWIQTLCEPCKGQ